MDTIAKPLSDWIDEANLNDHLLLAWKVSPATRDAQRRLKDAAQRGCLALRPVVSQGVDCTTDTTWARIRLLARRCEITDTGESVTLYEVLRESVYPGEEYMEEACVRRLFTDPAEAASLYRSWLDDDRYGLVGTSMLADALGTQAGA